MDMTKYEGHFCSAGQNLRALFFAAFVGFMLALAGLGVTATAAYADTSRLGDAAASSNASISTAATGKYATLSVTGTNDQTEARKMLDLVNTARAKQSSALSKLTWDYDLEKIAMQRAAELSIYFNHTRPNGLQLSSLATGYQSPAENLQVSGGSLNAVTANEKWLNNPTERANMIDSRFTSMAAASFVVNDCTCWVEVFGSSNKQTTVTAAVNGSRTYSIEALPSNISLSFSKTLPSNAVIGAFAQYTIVNTNKGWTYAKTPINANSFTWSSSDSYVVTIDAKGSAVAKEDGTTTITAKNKTLSSVSLSNKVTVKKASSGGSNSGGTNSGGTTSGGNSGGSNSGSSANKPSTGGSSSGSSTIGTASSAPVVSGKWIKSGSRWWFSYDAKTQKAQGKSYPANEFASINGKKYYFDSNGWMKTGWQKISNTWYYFKSSGAMATGWQKVKGKWYYLASDGKMKTGKITVSGKIYFLNSSGAMRTGWVKDASKWYYCDSSGAAAKGWKKVKNTWYYLGTDCVMKTGWITDKGNRYYLKSSGAMSKGWQKLSNKWHYFNTSGAMAKGWKKVSGKWYYLNPSDGIMKTGFYDVSGKRYYSNSSGAMKTGWQKISSKWYYFTKSGDMKKNAWISGKYWVKADGVMATSSWVGTDANHLYYVDGSGAWVKGVSLKG